MEEVWKDAIGYEDYIMVSNLGNARYKPRTMMVTRNGKQFMSRKPAGTYSPDLGSNGYYFINFLKAGQKRKKLTLHRLVAFAFVDGHFEGATVNHINGNKLDNRADNLEWVSLARNTQHQWETGLVNLRGENHPSSILTAKKVRIIRSLFRLGANCNQIAELLDLCPTTIYYIRDGKRWNSVE